ncbi:hydrolase [Clostridia bacterium]|nr:hydrolase [Clostridia bacterium]
MAYKVITIDGDGTLLNSDLSISPENKKAIAYAREKGARVLLCSGRSYMTLREFAREVGLQKGDVVICFNGALIIDGGTDETLFSSQISAQKANEVLDLLKPIKTEKADFLIYTDSYSALVERESADVKAYQEISKVNVTVVPNLQSAVSDLGEIVKILILGERDVLPAMAKAAESAGIVGLSSFFSSETLYEFISEDCSKGTGLAYAAKRYGADMAETIAIGDQANDISMIKAAGVGVAMKNATDEAKAAADYVTEHDNNHAGVAEAIYKFV